MGCLTLSALAALLTTCAVVSFAALTGDAQVELVSLPGSTPPEDAPSLDWVVSMFWVLTAIFAALGAAIWVKWRRQR
jgi:hypothetical protein